LFEVSKKSYFENMMCLLLVLVIALIYNLSVAHGAAVLIKRDDDLSVDSYAVEVPIKSNDPKESTCLPHKGSRLVKDGLFSDDDIETLHRIASKGYATRGEGVGGPTILDINTGFIRDSDGVENLFSREDDQKIFTSDDFAHYGRIINTLRSEVMKATGANDLHFTAPTFITRLDGRKSWEPKEIHDQYWHVHADRNNTAHYHYSGLLYLSMYKTDFTGGRILFYNQDTSAVDEVVEPRPGRVLIFTSGAENPHKVERVKSGQRLVLAFWFTCDEKKRFEIFLDGKKHETFANKVGASYRLQQGINAKKQQELEKEKEKNQEL